MRALLLVLCLVATPSHAQTPHQRRLDVLVEAAKAILVAEAARPRGKAQTLWCVAADAPDVRVRVATWLPHGQWLYCFPADLPPYWQGPWR